MNIPLQSQTQKEFEGKFPIAEKNGWTLDNWEDEHYHCMPPSGSEIYWFTTMNPRQANWNGMIVHIPDSFWKYYSKNVEEINKEFPKLY